MNKLRVGIAGYGIVGKRRRKFIDLNESMQTVAVCDIRFEGSGELEDGIRFYNNYKELLSDGLDVLFVCLTNDIASEVAVAGLRNGLHVFCEKPPGRNVQDVVNVRQEEEKHPHLKLMYGFNHRYHDSVLKAKEIIDSKELGKIINLRGVYGKSKILSFQSDWRTSREIAGGGILLDQGIHMVDLFRYFAGEFDEFHSFISNDFWNHDVEDNAYALMKSNSGIVAFLNSTATEWRHRFRLEICLEKGSINLTGILSGSKSYGAETITIAYRNGNDDTGDPKEMSIRYNEDNSWRDEINLFAKVIVENLKVENGSSWDALQTMRMVYKIYCADSKWKEKYNLHVDR
jgi:predicted dehydrogenase